MKCIVKTAHKSHESARMLSFRFVNIRVYSWAIMMLMSASAVAEEFPSIGTFNEAYELYRKNDFQTSEKLFNDVAAQTQNETLKAKALYNRGTALLAGTVSGNITNRLAAVADAISVFEQALELAPNEMDTKQNLERALNVMVENRIKEAARLLAETDGLLQQFQAKTAKENSEKAKQTLEPVQDDFAPEHDAVRPLLDHAESVLFLLENAIEKTREDMQNAKHAIDLFEYQTAADVMLADSTERKWAFDLDEKLAQEFQQLIQNNQNVINIVYPQNPLQP